MDALRTFNPISVRADIRDDMKRSIRFLEERGFRPDRFRWELRLDTGSCDLSACAAIEQDVAAKGIEVKTLEELKRSANRRRELYELETEITRDVPFPEAHTPPSYEQFLARRINDPKILADACFVALHGETIVGLSVVSLRKNDKALYIQVTGVKREYRHQGIATLLKLRAMAYARHHQYPTIVTWNEISNKSIFLINQRLGFVPRYTRIGMIRLFE